jgi:hypothetical protein
MDSYAAAKLFSVLDQLAEKYLVSNNGSSNGTIPDVLFDIAVSISGVKTSIDEHNETMKEINQRLITIIAAFDDRMDNIIDTMMELNEENKNNGH